MTHQSTALIPTLAPISCSIDPFQKSKKKKIPRDGAGRKDARGGGGGRRRRKHKRRDDNLIPLPENYSKTRWGDDSHRRRNRRRRRNRKLPEEWMKEAQVLADVLRLCVQGLLNKYDGN